MRAGDQFALQMEGFHVANAVVEEISNGEAIIYIPATRIVMGVSESLVERTPETSTTILTDNPLEAPESRASNSSRQRDPVETPEPPRPVSAPVGDLVADGDNYVPLAQRNFDSSAID